MKPQQPGPRTKVLTPAPNQGSRIAGNASSGDQGEIRSSTDPEFSGPIEDSTPKLYFRRVRASALSGSRAFSIAAHRATAKALPSAQGFRSHRRKGSYTMKF